MDTPTSDLLYVRYGCPHSATACAVCRRDIFLVFLRQSNESLLEACFSRSRCRSLLIINLVTVRTGTTTYLSRSSSLVPVCTYFASKELTNILADRAIIGGSKVQNDVNRINQYIKIGLSRVMIRFSCFMYFRSGFDRANIDKCVMPS
jgi:hypothetical protein